MSYHRLKKELKETFNLNKQIAYEKFIEKKIEKAKHTSDLLKLRPDWKEDFLIQKHKECYTL